MGLTDKIVACQSCIYISLETLPRTSILDSEPHSIEVSICGYRRVVVHIFCSTRVSLAEGGEAPENVWLEDTYKNTSKDPLSWRQLRPHPHSICLHVLDNEEGEVGPGWTLRGVDDGVVRSEKLQSVRR